MLATPRKHTMLWKSILWNPSVLILFFPLFACGGVGGRNSYQGFTSCVGKSGTGTGMSALASSGPACGGLRCGAQGVAVCSGGALT